MALNVPLKDREYWNPVEASKVLGRTPDFWVKAFEEKRVRGYVSPNGSKRKRRFILACSAREYLRYLNQFNDPPPPLYKDNQNTITDRSL